jgi:hypothetical protein
MADGRKNNGGHSTKGFAGRKPKADEIKIIEQMDAIAAPLEAWQALWLKVQEGDTQAIKTWLAYRFGQPKQVTDIQSKGDKIGAAPIIIYGPDDEM